MTTVQFKSSAKEKVFSVLFSVILIAVLFASWIFNIGWGRVVLTFVLFPFIQALAIFIFNLIAVKYFHYSKTILIFNIIFNVSCLLFHFTFADGGDIGGMYMFFHLITNEKIVEIASVFSGVFFIIHIVFLVLQITFMTTTKKRIKSELHTTSFPQEDRIQK